ncbi:hypothetical protein C8A05DRAFT_19874 [Staphylotrichum tortipilum]|uniref:Uncharacterized protein n=1 Tax=Staphylotrichum tortipilum TaxID=2831512 RepID=A0AAN6MC44_9PEZI|nr:hypothetical protein C8A05DRAFT_19874 [Staphylotrichum longicolle]
MTTPVRDYGALRATIVYNCAYMPAIRNNVRNYFHGTLPVAGQEQVFHYDSQTGDSGPTTIKRPQLQRDNICPNN